MRTGLYFARLVNVIQVTAILPSFREIGTKLVTKCEALPLPSQDECPLVDALSSVSLKIKVPFFFPGHKMGAGAPEVFGKKIFNGNAHALKHDLPELDELDNLFNPQGSIRDAERLASNLFGSSRTWFLANGSTAGVEALIMACVQVRRAQNSLTNPIIILPRNVHKCAIHALVLCGATPVFLSPFYDRPTGLFQGISTTDLEAALNTCINIAAVFIVSPTYTGAILDVREIAQLCHRKNVPLIVDEAHGTHLQFISSYFLQEHIESQFTDLRDNQHKEFEIDLSRAKNIAGSLQCGADAVVHSSHKTLNSMTQTAFLHLSDGLLCNVESTISSCLEMFQSSSPNYLLLASLDAARWDLGSNNKPGLQKLLIASFAAEHARTEIGKIPDVEVLSAKDIGESIAIDPLKVTIYFPEFNANIFDEILENEYGIYSELGTFKTITFAFGPGSSFLDAENLIFAINEVSKIFRNDISKHRIYESQIQCIPRISKQCLTPREAFFSPYLDVQLSDSMGRISAETITVYPPGIPVLLPGEEITLECINYLTEVSKLGLFVTGSSDPTFRRVRVVQ